MFRWLALALLLSAVSASAFEPWTECGKNMGFFEKPAYEAKSPKGGLYIEMPDNVGTMDLVTVRIHVNDPALRKNANMVEFLCDPGSCAINAGEKEVDPGDQYPFPYIKYSGEDVIELKVRNTYTSQRQGGVGYFSARFLQMKPPLAAGEYDKCDKEHSKNGTAWYGFSCERDRNYKKLCGSDKCDIAYRRLGQVGKQFMSHLVKMQSKPPAPATNRPSSSGPLDEVYQSKYEGYQATAPNGQQRYCSRGMTIGVYPTAEMESVALITSWYGNNAKNYKPTQPPGGLAAGKSFELRERDAASQEACDGSGCDSLVDYDISYTIVSDMAPEGTGTVRASVSKKDCVAKSRLKAEVDKTIAETKAFLASYKAAEQAPQTYKGMVCSDVKPQPMEPGTLTGRVTDGHEHPMAYMKLTLTAAGKEYPGFTDEAGNFEFKDVKGLKPDDKNPPEASLMIEYSYFRGGKNYFYVSGNDDKPVRLMKKWEVKSEGELRQDVSLMLNASANAKTLKTADGEYSIDNWGALWASSHLAAIYYYTGDAVDFSLTILKASVNYKLPFKVYVRGSSTYCSPDGYIAIGGADANYASTDRPKNREYHEFAHYLMYSEYGAWPEGFSMAGSRNHAGFINPSTGDSYVEGFAEFMAMVISEYGNDPDTEKPPYIYASFGSMKRKYTPYQDLGASEEFMVAGILWDMHDKDGLGLSVQQMWPVLKVKRKDFYEYYKAFRQAFPDKAGKIDEIFVDHQAFADKNMGNGIRDASEPFRDTPVPGNNSRYDPGEFYVDYGMKDDDPGEIRYDAGETIGKVTTYNRTGRSQAGYPPKAFIKVPNTDVRFYTVSVHNNNPEDGPDYQYITEAREGLLFLMPLPDGDDASFTITPKSQDYAAEKPYTITSAEYLKKYRATPDEKGYFDAHDFKLKPTGQHRDQKYQSLGEEESKWNTDGGPNVRGPPPAVKNTGSGGLPDGVDAKSVCPCLPLLPLVLAGLASALLKF